MSLELIRESLYLNQIIGEDSSQTLVDNDIIVPDVKPDIARVILLDGDVFVNSTEVVQDKILINGSICFKILYATEDSEQSVKSINSNSSFSSGLDITNAKPGMTGKVRCEIEHMDYSILNGRKINVKVIIKAKGKVIDEVEQSLITNIEGSEDVEVLKNRLSINSFLGESVTSCTLREALEVPPGNPSIKEILRNDIKISGKEYKLSDNKIVAKGDLVITTLYTSDEDDGRIQYMEHEVPFAEFLDLRGLTEESQCDLDVQIVDSRFEPEEDSDGEIRVMSSEIELALSVSGYEKKSVEVVEDAYSRNAKIELEKEPIKTEENVCENKSQIVLKDTILSQPESNEISEICNVLCKPALLEVKILNEKVVVQGLVNNKVLYLANDNDKQVHSFNQDVPFEHSAEVKGIKPGMGCDVGLDIDHCNYSLISSNEVEIRLVLTMNLKAFNKISLPLVVKVVESPREAVSIDNQPSLIIYFAKPGDNLWKIAKRYLTTIEDIKRVNTLGDDDQILAGQQIIIPKKVS